MAWETATAGAGAPLITAMHADGNLVVYGTGWAVAWMTGTWGVRGAWLQIADDQLALRDPEGVAIWTAWLGAPVLAKQAPAAGATVPGPTVTLSLLTGSLLPARGARPGWESLACAPGIRVLAYSTVANLPDGGSIQSAAIGHALSWAGAFAGLTIWNIASQAPPE